MKGKEMKRIDITIILMIVFLVIAVISGLAWLNNICIAKEWYSDVDIRIKLNAEYQPISPDSIIPMPQKVEMLSDLSVMVDSKWRIVADLSNEHDNFTADYLKNKILESFSLDLDVIDISEIRVANNHIGATRSSGKNEIGSNRKIIVIGNPNNNLAINRTASLEGIDIDSEIQAGFNQGYILQVNPEKILILADSTTGTFYGTISLTWLLKTQGGSIILPHTKITDWPDLEIRGFYGEGDFIWDGKKINTYLDREEWIEILAEYKYNLWTMSLFRLTDESSASSINREVEMEKFLRLMHFYPTVQLSPLTLRGYNENLHEGVFAQNISLKFNDFDYATPIESDDNLLKNSDLEDDIDGDTIPDYWTFTYQESPDDYWSIDYSESHSGDCSAKLTLLKDLPDVGSSSYQEASSSYLYTWSPEINNYPLKPNKVYFLSFWAKKKEASNNGRNPQVTVVLKDESGKSYVYTQSAFIKKGDNQWRQHYIVFSTYNGETKMHIYSRALSTNALEFWVDDFQMTDITDKLLNVIETPDTKLEVWDKDKTIKYTEGVDYNLEEAGDFNFKNPVLGKKTYIKRIPSGNISAEAEIIADYDFIVNLNPYRDEYITLSDPLIYELYDKYMLQETMTYLDLDYVFIGLDEIRGFNRDSRSKKRGLENYQLLAQFTNDIIDMIYSYNPDTKVLLWDDMFNPYHNGGYEDYQIKYGGQIGATWHALDLLKKDNVMLISWWYSASDSKGKMANSPGLYNELSLKFLGGPWDNVENIKHWSRLCYMNNAAGMMGHEFYNRIGGVPIAADYSWNAVKSYPE